LGDCSSNRDLLGRASNAGSQSQSEFVRTGTATLEIMGSNPGRDLLNGELQNLLVNSQARNNQQIRSSLLIAALVGVLVWKTQWPAIQPGLIVLLVGQLGLAGFLIFFNLRRKSPMKLNELLAVEGSAMRKAAWLGNGSRLLGFALLGSGVWRSTHNLPISIGLGVVYPAVIAWGLVRSSGRAKRLETARRRMEGLGPDPDAR
jgi:hypothetical protein